MPITATFGLIFLVAKVDVVGPNPSARSNNKRRLPKGSPFFVIRSGGMRSHEKVGPTRTRGGRKYADEVKPSEDAAATPIPLPAPIIKEGYRKVAFFVIRSGGMRSHEKVGPTRTRGGRKYADEVKPSEDAAATHITCVFNFCNLIKII